MAAELIGVDKLGSNHNLCTLHAGNAQHLRMINVHVHTQKDVSDRGLDRFDFVILGKLRLIVQVAVSSALDSQNLAFGREQTQIKNIVDYKAAWNQVDVVFHRILAAGIEIIGSVPFGNIGFYIRKNHQVGKRFDLSEGGSNTHYGTRHVCHLFRTEINGFLRISHGSIILFRAIDCKEKR